MRHSTAWQDSISLSFDESWPIGFYSRYSFPLYDRKYIWSEQYELKIDLHLPNTPAFFPLCSRRWSTNLQPVAINAQIVCNLGTFGSDCITKYNEFYAKSQQFGLMPFRLSRAVASMLKSSFSLTSFRMQNRILTYDLLQMRKIYYDMMREHLRASRICKKIRLEWSLCFPCIQFHYTRHSRLPGVVEWNRGLAQYKIPNIIMNRL